MPLLYLASKSPRRKSILESMGLTDIVVMPVGDKRLTAYAGDEERLAGESVADYVERTAKEKALAILARIQAEGLPPAPVLAADTSVILDDTILGKPADTQEAIRFMKALSGNTHEVRTVVVVASATNLAVRTSVSHVHFKHLTETEIRHYVATDEPYDKAGGYGIQGLAGLFIDTISGSYSGIMGLPVFETAELLRPYGLLSI